MDEMAQWEVRAGCMERLKGNGGAFEVSGKGLPDGYG